MLRRATKRDSVFSNKESICDQGEGSFRGERGRIQITARWGIHGLRMVRKVHPRSLAAKGGGEEMVLETDSMPPEVDDKIIDFAACSNFMLTQHPSACIRIPGPTQTSGPPDRVTVT